MRKILFCLVISLLGMIGYKEPVEAETVKNEMNLYVMYLENEEKGDSVLMESKGEYLLMDMGVDTHLKPIIHQLKTLGVTKLSIYFSHLHRDHVGGKGGEEPHLMSGLNQILDEGFEIENLYVPDPSLAPRSYELEERYGLKYKRIINLIEERSNNTQIIYLKKGDEITLGDVQGKVIGPVDPESISPEMYVPDKEEEEQEEIQDETALSYTYYENNLSLVSIFTCGNTRYFTAGDCLSDEAKSLVETYGDELNCDIMKLSHHGTGSGNTAQLFAAVKPRYSFASNTGFTGLNPQKEQWQTYVASKRASKYGYYYMAGSEKETLIIHVEDDNILLYRGKSMEQNSYLTGWQKVIGADGKNRTFDMYYFDEYGHPVTGIQKIDGKFTNFGTSGCMQYGNYVDGVYQGWHSYDEGRRYYQFSADEGKNFAYMLTGFQCIEGKDYYFNEDGIRITGNKKTEFRIIENRTYVLTEKGEIVRNDFVTVDGKCYYCDENGQIIKNKKITLASGEYIFDPYGRLYKADKKYVKVYLNGNCYVVDTNGIIVKNRFVSFDGFTYYCGKSGLFVKNKKFRIGNQRYISNVYGIIQKARSQYSFVSYQGTTFVVNQKGQIVKNRLVLIQGEEYYAGKTGQAVKNNFIRLSSSGISYFDQNGKKQRSCMMEINGKQYYLDNKGNILVNSQKKVGNNYYFFGSTGAMAKSRMVRIGNHTYYFDHHGKRVHSAMKTYRGKRYYFNYRGWMVKNRWVTIKNVRYYFGKTGARIESQKKKIQGKTYIFNKSGRWKEIKKSVRKKKVKKTTKSKLVNE